MTANDERRAFYASLARMPSEPEPQRLPPGIAGKRVKPWLAERARMARTLREVRRFDDAFLPAMADLWVATWSATMPSIDFEARRDWLVDHLVAALARGEEIRVAVVETGEIAGFVLIDPATGWLDQIAVGPEQRGCGVAEALLTEARRISPDRIGLDVNSENTRAVAFYRNQGFEVVGEGSNPRSGLPILKLEWRRRSAAI